MNDDTFNMTMRKFLKTVGVTSQQKIEAVVRAAQAAGTLPGDDLAVRVTLEIPALGLTHVVSGEIRTEGQA